MLVIAEIILNETLINRVLTEHSFTPKVKILSFFSAYDKHNTRLEVGKYDA